MLLCFFFFFSSRRRHTRYIGDWSSDVCSSDLSGSTWTFTLPVTFVAPPPPPVNAQGPLLPADQWTYSLWTRSSIKTDGTPLARSEERRVGKEGGRRGGGWT